MAADWFRSPIVFAEAKGVAGLGKAGGDGSQGPDKTGQQVPPEVYMALTYAGTLFLFTLSVPLILYGLNKLLNKIEECLGCGASSKAKKLRKESSSTAAAMSKQQGKQFSSQPAPNAAALQQRPPDLAGVNNLAGQPMAKTDQGNNQIHPNGLSTITRQQNYVQTSQRIGQLEFFQNQPKYSQFISMSKPDYSNIQSQHQAMLSEKTGDNIENSNIDRHHSPLGGQLPLAGALHMAGGIQGDARDYFEQRGPR